MTDNQKSSVLNMLHELMQQKDGNGWVTTRQIADAMDKSIYCARADLIALRNGGRVISTQKGRGRHNPLLWKVLP